jgi:hypothetical protein
MPEHAHPAASTVTPQLDAYPRLCGLPVTIERIAARPVGARRPMARSLTAFLVVAAIVLAGASAARAQEPVPTPQTNARAAGHISAIIPPRVIPLRVVPVARRTPRVQQWAAHVNGFWPRVKLYAREHPDEILDAFGDLGDVIETAVDLWDPSDPRTCKPVIEPLCTSVAQKHNSYWPAVGIVLVGPNAGTRVALTCQGTIRGQLAYYTPTLRAAFFVRQVWTYWYPGTVPRMAPCR